MKASAEVYNIVYDLIMLFNNCHKLNVPTAN